MGKGAGREAALAMLRGRESVQEEADSPLRRNDAGLRGSGTFSENERADPSAPAPDDAGDEEFRSQDAGARFARTIRAANRSLAR
jgi:hypothetical protein